MKDVQRIGRKCPFCRSHRVRGVGRVEIGGMWTMKEVECGNCGEDWCAVHNLVDIEKEKWGEDLSRL